MGALHDRVGMGDGLRLVIPEPAQARLKVGERSRGLRCTPTTAAESLAPVRGGMDLQQAARIGGMDRQTLRDCGSWFHEQ